MINQKIAESMLTEFDGCDNDTPGSPAHRAIWIFGIEPGDSIADKRKRSESALQTATSVPSDQVYSIDRQLKWPFNQKTFKLLAAIEGLRVQDYKDFANKNQPFVKGSEGYFKGNIYPYACNNVGEWSLEDAAETGCTKGEYLHWCNENRIPAIHSWVRKYQPKVFVGVGIGYKNIFSRAVFGKDVNLTEIQISGKSQTKTIFSHSEGGSKLVVIPHFSGVYGMNCNMSIERAGQYIAGLLAQT